MALLQEQDAFPSVCCIEQSNGDGPDFVGTAAAESSRSSPVVGATFTALDSTSAAEGPSSSRSSQVVGAGPTAVGGLRDRMKMGLKIDTKDKGAAGKAGRKNFTLLKGDDKIDKFYDFGDQIYDGGPRSRVLKAFRRSDGKEVVVKVRAKKADKASERVWREVMAQLCGMGQKSLHVLDIHEILEDETNFFYCNADL
jgi:hypothetical protein